MNRQNRTVLQLKKRTGVRLGAIALGLTAVLLPSCAIDTSTEESAAESANVTTEEVTEDTSALVGQEITVRNMVENTVGDDSFLLETDAGELILVVNASGAPFERPAEDIPIQATGTVETFLVDDINQEYGLNLTNDLYADYESQPVIIAESIALAPNPEYFYNAPEEYFEGKAIAVEGDVRLLENTNNAFALFEEGWADDVGVLVIGVDSYYEGGAIEEGENVVATGVARQATEQLLRDANLGWDDNQLQEFLSRYENRPVIAADGVYPSAVDPAPGN